MTDLVRVCFSGSRKARWERDVLLEATVGATVIVSPVLRGRRG